MFDKFWDSWPKGKRKAVGAAKKAWDKLKPDRQLAEAIIAGVEREKTWREKAEKYNAKAPRGQQIFIPHWKHAATWLNQQCWEDEHEDIPSETQKAQPKKTMCATCKQEEGKYPVAGILYCIRCYDKAAHPENYAPKLRVVK